MCEVATEMVLHGTNLSVGKLSTGTAEMPQQYSLFHID